MVGLMIKHQKSVVERLHIRLLRSLRRTCNVGKAAKELSDAQRLCHERANASQALERHSGAINYLICAAVVQPKQAGRDRLAFGRWAMMMMSY
jgi:hypothetical protein